MLGGGPLLPCIVPQTPARRRLPADACVALGCARLWPPGTYRVLTWAPVYSGPIGETWRREFLRSRALRAGRCLFLCRRIGALAAQRVVYRPGLLYPHPRGSIRQASRGCPLGARAEAAPHSIALI
eukprot:scaffold12865_cov71-Phaeocystis_antarctica.AAC.3